MTFFVRVLDPSTDEKPGALLGAIRTVNASESHGSAAQVFDRSPHAFRTIPSSPFAYWVSNAVRDIFKKFDRFEAAERTVKQGLATADDFRFVRASWEVPEQNINKRWFSYAKGGSFSPFYADISVCVNWGDNGAEIKNNLNAQGGIRSNVWMLRDTADKYFQHPGLTWPLRGIHLSAQAVPSNCIFSVAGKMAFAGERELLPYLAIFNSRPFDFLVNTRAGKVGGVQYEVGLVQDTPVPELSEADLSRFSNAAYRAWSLKRSLDTTNEASHAFLLPTNVNETVTGLDREAVKRELETIQRQIDAAAFALYGIGPDDRAVIDAASKQFAFSDDAREGDGEEDGVDSAEDDVPVGATSDALNSWFIGVAFGRFDLRLVTGERPIPPEPKPFDPLPSRSPGMYPEGDEPANRPDILVDDEGHSDDIAARAQSVAENVKVSVPEDLRAWIAKEFFPLHIKMYSKSRRKAPIYWQLATPSASYSVWLYIHAFGKDTLFRVQNDYAVQKLAHEERRLESLISELREGATATQRKELAAQEALVEELRAFLDEVKRVAPLWSPNLDDGVVINFAPLWRIVPQHKAWQRELKSTWDALSDGRYDWAHLAMHFWPERVVPKCAKDRSLAIAHGLEDVFWVKGADGKWSPRKTPTRSAADLVRERTSPAVKSALKSLLEAPEARGTSGRRRAPATTAGEHG